MTAPVPRLAVPRLAALAVVLDRGHVLLVQRANPPDQGLWGYPGGKVDWGETVFAAAARELHEETGVSAAPVAHLANLDVIVADGQGAVAHHFLLVAVLCRYQAGRPVAGDDAMAAEWVPVDQVLARARPMSRDVETVLALALKAGDPALAPGA